MVSAIPHLAHDSGYKHRCVSVSRHDLQATGGYKLAGFAHLAGFTASADLDYDWENGEFCEQTFDIH